MFLTNFENYFKKTKLKVKITSHVIKMFEQTFNSKTALHKFVLKLNMHAYLENMI